MDEALTIEVRHEQGCAIVTVAGEIDISTVTPLRDRLFEVAASGAPLVVDLEQVSFIDSVGLATLVGAAKRAAAHGGTLQVACALPKIRQLVRLTQLDRRIPLFHTVDEALAFRAPSSTNPPFLAAQLWRLTSSGPGAARLVTRLESGGDDVLRAFPSLRVLHYREGQRPEERYLAQ